MFGIYDACLLVWWVPELYNIVIIDVWAETAATLPVTSYAPVIQSNVWTMLLQLLDSYTHTYFNIYKWVMVNTSALFAWIQNNSTMFDNLENFGM